ncbi:hypothetical protein ACU18_12280 [Arthrobacter sp. ZBG10]|uniref:DivIVA domain-containing protein n=1 Tax=Arthrobacter sp. ZBG10 TaxID=1676590 RepID=UPI00068142C5|nr:DivIVA domain-containing protein [Arthrobacter sp. ZBG10]KNH16931.1 hypothetical protein ACU18_12280 [Arthrobacter sp. ZBG10]
MSFFLVFVAIALVGAVLWVSVGRRALKVAARPVPDLLEGGFEQPAANLPPVLLPARARPEDVDRVRFSLGLRGYRMDQVDEVLDELRDQLAARERDVTALRTRVLALESAADGGSPAPESAAPAAESGSQ